MPPRSPLALTRFAVFLLAVLALVVGIDNLERPLANPDEGRYSEIAREMAQSGDWVTPRLNGLKYFEKPPLQYWATAAAFTLFGESEQAARIYTWLCGMVSIAAVFLALRRLASLRVALLGAAVLTSSPYFLALGGIVTLDMGLTAWLTVALCAFLVAQARAHGERERRRLMLVAWAAIGLAILSKGLVGIVFPAAAIFLHCLFHRDWALLRRLEWIRGLALCAAITVPWFVLVARANPEFTHFFFVHEHFERFLTKTHRRVEPAWYFVPILFAGFLPWMLALVPAALAAWRNDLPQREFPWRRFALAWSVFVVAFFSASGSKLPAYILPVFPMLAMLLADWLDRSRPGRIAALLAPMIALVLVALAFGWNAPERAHNAWMRDLYLAARPWIVGGGIVLAAGYAFATWLLSRGEKHAAVAIVVAASLVFADAMEDGFEELSPRQSGLAVASAMLPHVKADTRLYSVDYYDQSATFYLKRPLTLVAYVDEFGLGQRSEPGRALPDVAAFRLDWQRPGDAVAIMQPGRYEQFKGENLPMRVLYADERRVAVLKPRSSP